MPITIDNLNQYPLRINDATPSKSGGMSSADKAKLDAIPAGGGGTAFQRTIIGGDGSDFIVIIPAGKEQANGNYNAVMTIQSGSIMTSYRIPYANQTATQFRVLTDAPLDVGTLVAFTLTGF